MPFAVNDRGTSKVSDGQYHILRTIRCTFFFKKLPPKFRCDLYSKCPLFDLKSLPVLKMAIYSMPWETYLHLATLNSTGSSSAQMQRIWGAGIHKLANTVSLPPHHPKPRTLSSLCCVISVYSDSELELNVICVISNSTIFLLVASFIIKKKVFIWCGL